MLAAYCDVFASMLHVQQQRDLLDGATTALKMAAAPPLGIESLGMTQHLSLKEKKRERVWGRVMLTAGSGLIVFLLK